MKKDSQELKPDLSNYDANKYKCPSVTVDVVICSIFDNDLKALLIKRRFPPFQDHRAIPGGFLEVDKNEDLEETALRELKEETNIQNIYLEQLFTYGKPKRDPRKRVITVAYYALVRNDQLKKQEIKGGDDAYDTRWFSLRNPPDKLAFDHSQILQDALKRIIGKISYSPIAFSLVPQKFTWNDLQNVYEIVLGKKLSTSNFRRKILSTYFIEEIKETIKGIRTPGRPSIFLKYNGVREEYV
jgi:8-oxo-dGTP diphosphatase